ncbi:MAG TPA: glycosyltransferase, partial [Acetobacteraceae bacterium]|nr:glycosyltransferase [Acetobacteraceae bacterium]
GDVLDVVLVDPSLFTVPYDRMLAGGLAANGHRVTLVGRPPRPDDGALGEIAVAPIFYRLSEQQVAARLPRVLRLALKGLDHAVSLRRLRRHLAGARPDVIHLQWLPLPALDRIALGKLRRLAPLVLTLHDSEPFNGNASARLQATGIARCYAQCDRIIVHTEQGIERLRTLGLPEERVVKLPHGPLETLPAVADAPPDPMQGPLRIVLFGKIKPYKGADILIEAFGQLPESLRAQAQVQIIGKPYMDLAPLAARAAVLGISDRVVIEPRFVPDEEVARIFGPGAIAAFPYREIEASGVMTLALAHGRPIVASRLGAFAETLTDGTEGALVPPGDIGALSLALARLIGDRPFARAAAVASRRLAAALPGWEEIGRRTADIYRAARRDWAATHGGAPRP